MNKRDFWIDLHYAVICIESKDDIIVIAPPLTKWMIGMTFKDIKPWLLKKKAIVKELN